MKLANVAGKWPKSETTPQTALGYASIAENSKNVIKLEQT